MLGNHLASVTRLLIIGAFTIRRLANPLETVLANARSRQSLEDLNPQNDKSILNNLASLLLKVL